MTFPRVKPGSWAFGEILTSAQMNTLDVDHANALDGAGGGTATPTAILTIAGSGLRVGGTFSQNGAFQTPTAKWAGAALDLSSGPSLALNMKDVAPWAEGMLIAPCANANDKVASSRDDGFSWIDKSASIGSPQAILLSCCAGAVGGSVLLGGNSAKVYFGVDDTSFGNFTLPGTPISIQVLHYDTVHSLFIAGGNTAGAPYIASITTGLTPTSRTVPAAITGANNILSIARSPAGILVASWDSQTKLAFSSDGTTWTATATTFTSGGYRVAYGDGVFLALDRSSATALKSTDGNTWTAVTAPASTSSSFTCLNGVFAATSGNKLWLSVDQGATWEAINVQYLAYSTLNKTRAVQGRLHVFCTDTTNSVDMRSRRLGFSDGTA